MRTNGTLQILTITDTDSFDKEGNPIAVDNSDNWGYPIPCLIKINTRNNKGTYDDGKFTIAKYEILIENSIDTDIGRVKLNQDGRSLGEFTVQDVQKLQSVGRTKIIV